MSLAKSIKLEQNVRTVKGLLNLMTLFLGTWTQLQQLYIFITLFVEKVPLSRFMGGTWRLARFTKPLRVNVMCESEFLYPPRPLK